MAALFFGAVNQKLRTRDLVRKFVAQRLGVLGAWGAWHGGLEGSGA